MNIIFDRKGWELAAWIATTLGFIFTIIALGIVAIQVWLQSRQSRLDALDTLFGQLDTHKARIDRETIYKLSPEQLRMDQVHADPELRETVEETVASLERVAYRILTRQVPETDTFNLYGGVLLSVASKLWPYILDQRAMRDRSPFAHKLTYRRYLEALARRWAPKYARRVGLRVPKMSLATEEILREIFGQTFDPEPKDAESAPNPRPKAGG